MKQALVVLLALLTATAARADGVPALVLEVRAERVTQSDVERALAEELKDTPDGGAAAGHLSLTEESDIVRLTYRDARGNTASRELHIVRDDPEALEKITLAAANLVRDQSQSLLSDLQATLGEPAKDTERPPPVKISQAEEPQPVPPYNPCRDGKALVVGGDFVPFLGTSSSRQGRESARHLSLNFGGSYSAGVRGLEVSLGFNIDKRGACGVQQAVGFNLAVGDVRGAQLALANGALGQVHGAQVGLANFARGGANVQIGVGNVSIRDVRGAQIGVGNLTLGDVRGLQIGAGNLSWGDVRGLQIGLGNLAHGDAVAQLGLVNVSRRAKAPIGFISIVREGRTTLDAWVSENGTLLSGVTHGGDYVHNLYAVGFRFGPSGTRVGHAHGIGVRLFRRPWLSLDLDALFEHWSRTDYINSSAMVARLRLTASVSITDRLGVFVAPGYAVMFTDDPEETTQATLGSTVLTRNRNRGAGGEDAIGFTSVSVGIRVALDAPQ